MPFGQVDKLCKLLDEMVDEAEATYEVSMAMLMKRSRLKVCARCATLHRVVGIGTTARST